MRRSVPVGLVAVALGLGAVAGGLTGCGSSAADDPYTQRVAKITNWLEDSATSMSGALVAASSAADVTTVHKAARSQLRLVSRALRETNSLDTTTGTEAMTRALRKAIVAHRAYLGSLLDITDGDGKSGLRRLPAAKQQVATVIADYKEFFNSTDGAIVDGLTDVGLGDLKGLRKALEAAATPAPTPAPAAAPSTPAPSGGGAGVNWDVVDYSGGEGVRYRYSPNMNDLVPGNGPMEGDTVTVECYTTGESVRGNSYWVSIDPIEGYVVPATYLRYGHNGPPAGVRYC